MLKPQPVLLLIQYCLCLLQSIACNLGHGRGSRLHIAAVIVQKPHKCDFACFSCFHLSWKRAEISNVLSSWSSLKANWATLENTLSSRLNRGRFWELLKSWHFKSTRFLPYSDDIVSCCGSLVCEWEHLVQRGGRVCVFVNSCVFMYTMTQTHSVPAKSLVYETPHTSPPSGPIQHGVQRAPRLATSGDPLPVLSPFNDWISSRLPSSRVIAWWSARCCARAGGSAWQWVWCWLGQSEQK